MTWTTFPVGSSAKMDLYVERPGAPKAPAVIVLQEIFGVNAHIRDVAKRVAALGYVAVAPDLFHRSQARFEGRYEDFASSRALAQKTTPDELEADLRATHEWLQQDAQVDGQRVAAWGFCMGGRVALRAAVLLPLRAAVSFYGGVADTMWSQLSQISGPVLLAWGGLDSHLGPAVRRKLADALAEAKKTYVDVVFSDAEHGFFCDHRASYNEKAATVAWATTSAFLAAHLR